MNGMQFDHLEQLADITTMLRTEPNGGPIDPTMEKVAKGYAFGAFRELESEGFRSEAEHVIFVAKNEGNRTE